MMHCTQRKKTNYFFCFSFHNMNCTYVETRAFFVFYCSSLYKKKKLTGVE